MDRNPTIKAMRGDRKAVALRKESVDRNNGAGNSAREQLMSLSARRAWIEICPVSAPCATPTVALRKESVDRNASVRCIWRVAQKSLSARRAWIEMQNYPYGKRNGMSLSARRAWIEIQKQSRLQTATMSSLSAKRAWIEISKADQLMHIKKVALRKESVDRNILLQRIHIVNNKSLSARRAWIEMSYNAQ